MTQISISIFIGFILAMMNVPSTQAANTTNFLVYLGTNSNSGGKGIYVYRFDAKTGKLTDLGLAAETEKPFFLTTSEDGRFLYTVNELNTFEGQEAGSVSSFAIHKDTGKLTTLNVVSARGTVPAHPVIDRSGKSLLLANYGGGSSVAVFPILENGSLGAASSMVQHKGSGVNPERQEGPHAHGIVMSPDNRFALVADLGIDQVIVYPFDPSKGTLGSAAHNVKVHPGAGPRHLVFSPNQKFVYLITEMGSTVVVYSYKALDGSLEELQTISTLPKEFAGKTDASEIEIDRSGKFLYASNRGADNIAVFAVDPKKGTLSSVGFTPTQGKTPRHFAIDPTGRWLIAENQNSDSLVIFKIDGKTGQLTQQGGAIKAPAPVCVKFVALQ